MLGTPSSCPGAAHDPRPAPPSGSLAGCGNARSSARSVGTKNGQAKVQFLQRKFRLIVSAIGANRLDFLCGLRSAFAIFAIKIFRKPTPKAFNRKGRKVLRKAREEIHVRMTIP